MKKLTALISVLTLLLSLCACSDPGAENTGNTDAPAASQAVSDGPVLDTAKPSATPSSAPAGETETPQPSAEPSAAPTATLEPTQDPTSEPTSADDLKAIAESLIGSPVSELYTAIGQPLAADYAPGCLEPDSEDGELIYSGFTVYTVRTATREYVYDVL